MASGALVGGGGDRGDESREKQRWTENKVYTRKFHRSSGKTGNSAATQSKQQQAPQQQQQSQPQPPASSHHIVATTTEVVNSSLQQPAPPPHHPHEQQLSSFESAASGDDASSLNDIGRRQNPASTSNRNNASVDNHTNHQHINHPNGGHQVNPQKLGNGIQGRVLISIQSKSRNEIRELRRKLKEELDQVRSLVKKLEARELRVAPTSALPPVTMGYSHSQLSANNVYHSGGVKRPAANSAASLRRQLSVSVATTQVDNNSMNEAVEKEKRTPKANQYYRNSEFLLGKDKFPPADSHKKSKANGSKKHHMSGAMEYGAGKKYVNALKSCSGLLDKLMKHKYGWVFNIPVDVEGLGLVDYHKIIKHPMDLGTVKARLSNNWYKHPRDFASDVRLTFSNAMTYNPKGQDVHIMAEQLSTIFEERWPRIEAEYAAIHYPVPTKIAHSLDMRALERSDSTSRPVMPDTTANPVTYKPHVGRAPALKKPKAKDPDKRDMTYDEKQRLSNNLQSIPPEKLDCIVQIIKKRNTSLSQNDDEIEVDIDSVDAETLWELDRFVTNYKKSLSKNKRKAELAILARSGTAQNTQEEKNSGSAPANMEPAEGRKETGAEKHIGSPLPTAVEKQADGYQSSSSSSSSSDSGSSSSDSDSESSSGYGSDVARSPQTK